MSELPWRFDAMRNLQIPERISFSVTKCPFALFMLFFTSVLLAGGMVWKTARFESEILNLLPEDVPAVEGLKLYNRRFTQSRELTFFFQTPGDAALLEDFRTHFCTELAKQKWVVRFIDAPPVESAVTRSQAAAFFLPMLLNLPAERVKAAAARLEPDALRQRLEHLAPRLRSGMLTSQIEWEFDPLGIFSEAAAELATAGDLQESFQLTNISGDAQIVSVITNQASLSTDDCRAMMQTVRDFVERTRASFAENAPLVWITGRSAYVDEISASMRADIVKTSLLSLLAILTVFWIAYRSLLPLLALLVLLPACSLFALAAGALLFPELNLIAIAFCSILFGLGNDFGLLLVEQYQSEPGERAARIARALRRRWPSIAGVAITTALGFSALLLSNSPGFAQLGVLTALGILFCAGLLPVFFFLGVPERLTPPLRGLSAIHSILFSKRTAMVSLSLCAGALALAISPWKPLEFDASPRSLEPRGIPASIAVQKMLETFPSAFEPMMIVVKEVSPERAATRLRALQQALAELKKEDAILSFSGASPFALDPQRISMNTAYLRNLDWKAIRETLTKVGEQTGMRFLESPAVRSALETLESLQAQEKTMAFLDWNNGLPADSAWWFLIDRMVSPARDTYLLYIHATGAENIHRVAAKIASVDPNAMLTGWRVILQALLPWAKLELRIFSIGVAGIILLTLLVYYRNFRAWCVHAIALFFSAGLMLALLKVFDVRINLLNVLALPLIVGVGVDYSTHFLLAALQPGDTASNLSTVVKPVFISGLTTIAGFGALSFASNPALSGLGIVCASGIAACLVVSLFFVLPLCTRIKSYKNQCQTG